MKPAVQSFEETGTGPSNAWKPYPAYQDSRLPWVPEVPAHWGLLPNRAMLSRRKILGARVLDGVFKERMFAPVIV